MGNKVTKDCDRCGKITNLKGIHIIKEVYNNGVSYAWVCDECYRKEKDG